jgi:hypothetical protein
MSRILGQVTAGKEEWAIWLIEQTIGIETVSISFPFEPRAFAKGYLAPIDDDGARKVAGMAGMDCLDGVACQ